MLDLELIESLLRKSKVANPIEYMWSFRLKGETIIYGSSKSDVITIKHYLGELSVPSDLPDYFNLADLIEKSVMLGSLSSSISSKGIKVSYSYPISINNLLEIKLFNKAIKEFYKELATVDKTFNKKAELNLKTPDSKISRRIDLDYLERDLGEDNESKNQ
ncbi:hypothetical protein H6G33_10510 [Calothrix sp. FACHB-1219]|uniref:hypothetical protein n=1 Tax=unclassified Calothrix TaxID=2619626 RepID=UPI001683E228|nr:MULTISPECIES: hypothetical protein [unclassified Calothrix]MBD2201779.1 hypothetical protein [Calothrix sp. FACHB-168]MBD2217465.1 hypothetical protein [Calothrix sp. FACHB-1219]